MFFIKQSVILRYYLGRLFGRPVRFLENVCASKSITLENVIHAPYCVYFENDNINKIPENIPAKIRNIEYWGDRSRKHVLEQLKRKEILLDRSIYYILKDALITERSIYCSGARHNLKKKEFSFRTFWGTNNLDEYDAAVFAHNYFSSRFWGHWLMSELPMQFGLRDAGLFVGHTSRSSYRDEEFWRKTLDLPKINNQRASFVHKLILRDSRVLDPDTIRSWYSIRKKIIKKSKAEKKIYIKRDQGGQTRCLTNEDELITFLVKKGFTVFDLAEHDGQELMTTLNNADIVIGVEGSHMDPVLYTVKDNGLLIVLQPPGRVSLNTVTNTSICGVDCAVYVCDFGEDYFNFNIKIDDFSAYVDRVLNWGCKNDTMYKQRLLKFQSTLDLQADTVK